MTAPESTMETTETSYVQSASNMFIRGPNVNLVSNIGFGEEATHTKGGDRLAMLPAVQMNFPLKHPPFVIQDDRADRLTHKTCFEAGLFVRLANYIKKLLG